MPTTSAEVNPLCNELHDVRPHKRAVTLGNLVTQAINERPFTFDGHQWAARTQAEWCDMLEVSPATLRRIIGKPPFVTDRARVNGVVTSLLRLGEKGPATPRQIAMKLRFTWLKYLKAAGFNPKQKCDLPVDAREFGCLCGLAERWGDEAAEILGVVVRNWTLFMVGVKLHDDWGADARHYRFPSLSVIRRFPDVAEEVALIKHQEQTTAK